MATNPADTPRVQRTLPVSFAAPLAEDGPPPQPITSRPAATIIAQAPIILQAGQAQKVLGANAKRRAVLLRGLNPGPSVYVGGAFPAPGLNGSGYYAGVPVIGTECITIETTAEIWAYCSGAAVLSVLELTD